MDKEGPEKDPNLLIEYQCAQDSAQHHDNLVWQITYTLLGANLILLGFVINQIKEVSGLQVIFVLLSVLGILSNVFVLMCVEPLAQLKIFKYNRCKEIENIFGFKQHTDVEWESRYHRNALICFIFFFIVTWSIVIIKVVASE